MPDEILTAVKVPRFRSLSTSADPGADRQRVRGTVMELEKYTDRAKGFLQAAQTLALRSGHQRLTPEHLLKVFLEDPQGLCANLIRAAGGDPKAALDTLEDELARLPRVE